mmetsp:Transcript_28371/g.92652  ORF Transcript_28371/g.92652 Transcript_28371/m.92652 type:complete len:250 (-) Transcript_28371:66-815(-)
MSANRFSLLSLGSDEEEDKQTVQAVRDEGSKKRGKKKGRRAAAADEEDDASSSAAASTPDQPARAHDETLQNPLVFIDLEMTGLDPSTCTIIEIAVICTDGHLRHVHEGPNLVIHQPDEVLAGMNEWCIEVHGKSGLTQRVRESTTTMAEAEAEVLAFVQRFSRYQQANLAGNSVGKDRQFLEAYMPELAAHFHYRIVDVSSVKELCYRWYPEDARKAPRKKCTHTALSDIRESIEELKYLRRAIFKKR